MVDIWRKLGSIHLTVVLCLLLAADLALGYVCLERHTALFAPMNDIGLVAWARTYGRQNPVHTAWFFILLCLLTLLCVNTFVCTTDKVARLMSRRKQFKARRLFFKLAPHVMHYALIVILTGYLSSYLFARVLDTRTLILDKSISLAGTDGHITFTEFIPEFYQGDRLPAFKNRVLRPRARLRLTDGEYSRTAELNSTGPVHFKGYTITLKDFAPRQKGGMGLRTRIDLSIRKDPGVGLYLAGIVLFTVGLVMYSAERFAVTGYR
jgi:cytochrome c biogenesis protein ResB